MHIEPELPKVKDRVQMARDAMGSVGHHTALRSV